MTATKTADDIRRTEAALEARLNAAKRRVDPAGLYNTLKIKHGYIQNPIAVTYAMGQYFAGAGDAEFCLALGRNEGEANAMLDRLGL